MNQAQQECIDTIDGQVIVIACPGAGKTTTLLARIRHMVSMGIAPEHILMMTFTRAAAEEMRKRYESEPGSKKGVTFATIHALCLAILMKYRDRPEIMSENGKKDFFFSMLRDSSSKHPSMNISSTIRAKLATISDREQFISDLVLDISAQKNNPGKKTRRNSTPDEALFRFLWNTYEAHKEEQGCIDFDDMLTQAYSLLLNDRDALGELRDRYRYIQVDEYQDTNYVQRDIIYLIAGRNGNLAVVGDDDQSIYGFRGACPEVMLGFPKDYPSAKMIRMGINYRSEKDIVECAGRMIGRNRSRFEKEFHAHKVGKGLIELTLSTAKAEEHALIAEHTEKLLQSGVPDTEIAVLYRTNKEAEGIAGAMLRRGIEVQVADGITDRYEHWIYKDILAYYRLANGHGSDRDLLQVLNHPQRYLRPISTGGAFEPSREFEDWMIRSVYEGSEESWKIGKAVREVENFFQLLRSLKGKNPKAFLATLKYTYRRYLKAYAEFRGMDMEELTSIWDSYEEDIRGLSEQKWNTWEDYTHRYGYGIRQARKSKKGVLLSSMHKSKGLEWEHVMIANCVDGNIPYQPKDKPCDREEERRLFYVACTRAKKHLELLAYDKFGGKPVNVSPFIGEMTKR